jgi:membrane-bound lytic murein transglycosylase C
MRALSPRRLAEACCAPLLLAALLLGALQLAPLGARDADIRRQLWTEVHESSRNEWVDYCASGDSFSRVDFEKGRFEVQTLVPVPPPEPGAPGGERYGELDVDQWNQVREQAREKLARQVEQMLTKAEPGRPPVMKDQILDPDDKFLVEAKHAARYTQHHLLPQMVVDEKPVTGADGVQRLRVKVQFDLVPDHMKVRARRYKAKVEECAKRFGMKPAMIYAVMHSESNFNPMCVSRTGARGLMQLMPEAASEADRFLRGAKTERPVPPEKLFDSDYNILLGTAYLHMLKVNYFGELKNAENGRMLSIAAYNCGPFYVKRRILPKGDFETLTTAEALKLIRARAPLETRYYLPRVLNRMELYEDL